MKSATSPSTQKKLANFTPVVLSGGAGTRLWPISRLSFPKQFCELMDESLLEKTLKRVGSLGSPWTLTINELQTLTGRVFRNLDVPLNQIIFEPTARNTAPAIALLCKLFELQKRNQEIIGIFPADHLITKEQVFSEAIELAVECAKKNLVVTLGIQPEYPATGFGYIETSQNQVEKKSDLTAWVVQGFREKPDLETAKDFLAKKNFYWNAGIFVFKVETMIKHLKSFTPEIWNGLEPLKIDLSNLKEIYSSLPKISIDYGVMERLKGDLACIPCDIGWSDLGSWDDVSNINETPFAREFENKSDVVTARSENNFVFSMTKKVYGLLDVNDLIVVDTPDAMLVTKKGSSQDVRLIVDQLTKRGHITAKEHLFEKRPWGIYTVLREEMDYKSKLIAVDPGAQISYQLHYKRNEHWVIVRGQAEVTLDGEIKKLGPGESVFVKAGTKHRIRNTGTEPLEFIEVQTGLYFGEDDIIRFQDDYNRA